MFFVYSQVEYGPVFQNRKHLEQTQWLKREDIRRIQTKHAKTMLAHAYNNVKFYHRSFKKAGFHPSQFHSLDDMCRVPILRKQDFRMNVQELRASTVPTRAQELLRTSGTTATPVEFYRDKKDVGRGLAAELRGFDWAGYRIGDKMALMWNFTQKARSAKFRIANRIRRCKFFNINNISEDSMQDFATLLHRFKPKFIRGHAGALNLFASFLQQNDGFKINPSAVFTACETLLPNYRKNIESTFNCRVYDYYASSEVSHIGAQCEHSEGFHITDENVLVEIVEDGKNVSSGKDGRVLVTNLHGFGMPFIRYDIGDRGRILSDECECGRGLSLMNVFGRTNEYFVTGDGSFLFLKDFQRFFEDLPVVNFEVVQKSLDEIVVNVVPAAGYLQQHTDFILRNLKYVGSGNISVNLVNSIRPHGSGKFTHVVSKIKGDY
jgi:phenylacetate-CoA ligase